MAAEKKQGWGCLQLDRGPLSWLSVVSAVQWQGFSTEGLGGSRWALGPSCGLMAVTLLPPKNSSLWLHAIAHPPLHSLTCPLSRLLLVTPACGHSTSQPSRRGQPSPFLSHPAPSWASADCQPALAELRPFFSRPLWLMTSRWMALSPNVDVPFPVYIKIHGCAS